MRGLLHPREVLQALVAHRHQLARAAHVRRHRLSRRYEIASDNADKQRAVLKLYSAKSLTWALGLTGVLTFGTYLAYTLDADTQAFFQSKLLWLTAPFTAFGLIRFLYLVTGRGGKGLRSESPTQEMLRDVPFVLNLVVWVVVVVAIVYRLQPA